MGIGGVRRSLARGLVTEERLRKMVPAPRLIATAIEGTVGSAIAEVPLALSNRMDQTPYGIEESVANIALGGAFAVGIRYSLRGAGHLLMKLTPETRHAGAIKAVAVNGSSLMP
jgi:hypothetical protein